MGEIFFSSKKKTNKWRRSLRETNEGKLLYAKGHWFAQWLIIKTQEKVLYIKKVGFTSFLFALIGRTSSSATTAAAETTAGSTSGHLAAAAVRAAPAGASPASSVTPRSRWHFVTPAPSVTPAGSVVASRPSSSSASSHAPSHASPHSV
jgi:hypothetical protein